MNTIQVFTTISAIVLTIFLLYSLYKHGITRSISAIYYKLETGKKWYYTATMIGLAIPLIIAIGVSTMQNLSSNAVWATIFFTAAGIFIVFTGLAPDTRNSEDVEKIHVIGATGGMFLAGIGLLFLPVWYWVIPQIVFSGILHYGKVRYRTYWIEIVNFICIAGALYFLSA